MSMTIPVDLEQKRVREGMIAALPVITPRTTVGAALRLLREHCLPALPVCEGERFVGLVDEKSLLRLTPSEATTLDAWEQSQLLEKLTVARVVAPTQAVAPDTSLYEAAVLMGNRSSQVIPVLDGDRLIGLLPWQSVLSAVTDRPASSIAC